MTLPWLTGAGLSDGVLSAGTVDDQAWRAAVATRQHVGSCRVPRCGGQLLPGLPDTGDRRVVFYPAVCVVCGHEVSARVPRASEKGAE